MPSFHEHPNPTSTNMNLKAIAVLLLFSLFSLPCFSQTDPALKKADKLYQEQAYDSAIQLYNDAEPDLAAMEKLANSYRLVNDTENAEKWYAKIVAHSSDPLNLLHYAQALQSNGHRQQAKDFYKKYGEATSTGFDNRGHNLAAAIERMPMNDNGEVVIKNALALNSDKLDFSPVFFNNGIVFASTRQPGNNLPNHSDKWTGDAYANLYFSEYQPNGDLSDPAAFATGLRSKHHQGPLAFYPSGLEMLFTGNVARRTGKGEKELFLNITKAVKDGKQWLRAAAFDLGDGTWNDAHPALTADGKLLYFASDRPGGYGGMDLYCARFSDGKCGLPVNLGAEINTPGNEVFPFIYADGTLYFASDGWGGYGGLDIFHSEPDAEGYWQQSANLGLPFNSPKDDFGYVLDLTGSNGFFTSARKGGLGKDDIYEFHLPAPQSNKYSRLPNATVCTVDGSTGQPVAGARVSVFSKISDGSYVGYEKDYMVKLVASDGEDGFEKRRLPADPFGPDELLNNHFETGPDGQASLYLNPSNTYLLQVDMPGYEPANVGYSPDATADCIPLKPASCIQLAGRIADKQQRGFIAGAAISAVNLTTGEQLETDSDEAGQYSFCLERDCDFIVTATKKDFIEENALVSTVREGGLGGLVNKDLRLTPVFAGAVSAPTTAGSLFAEGVLINLDHIYYDFGQSNIRPDAAKELDLVVDFLKRHPALSVELRSHTDSRGDDDFNRELSQKRAQASLEYLVQNGIEKSRLMAIGLGEDQLLNRCNDGVKCTEEEHQVNRRTELRIKN